MKAISLSLIVTNYIDHRSRATAILALDTPPSTQGKSLRDLITIVSVLQVVIQVYYVIYICRYRYVVPAINNKRLIAEN